MDHDTARSEDLYIAGLKNAHAMEMQALSIMRPQVKRIEHYPEIENLLRQHIAETEGQAERLEGLLEACGTDKSTLKDLTMSVAGGMAAMAHTPAGDEILKNSFANFAFENFEIAAYRSLIALAQASGHAEGIATLQENLNEELRMAELIEQSLPALTQKFVALSESGMTAKT